MIKKKISFVLPVYNNSKTLKTLVAKIEKFLKDYNFKKYEIIMVDDRSTDKSWKIITDLSFKRKNYIGIRLRKNSGQSNALMAGLENSTGDFVFTMDADLQDRTEDLNKFIEKINSNKNIDMILGRKINYNPNYIKRLGSIIFFSLFRLFSGIKLNNSSNFRLMKRSLVRELINGNKYNIQLSIAPLALGYKVDYVDVLWKDYKSISNYTFLKSLKLALYNLFFYTKLNVIVPISLTLFVILILLALAIYIIYLYLVQGTTIPGYYSIIILILFGFVMNLILFLSLIISINNINKIVRDEKNYSVQEKLNI
mgnify:CR=1 FL=1